jgi:hypothetical protein
VVTTRGALTEPLWDHHQAVVLADVGDLKGFVDAALVLIDDDAARCDLGINGRRLYDEMFSLGRVVAALTAA